jgi:hypothetical protein
VVARDSRGEEEAAPQEFGLADGGVSCGGEDRRLEAGTIDSLAVMTGAGTIGVGACDGEDRRWASGRGRPARRGVLDAGGVGAQTAALGRQWWESEGEGENGKEIGLLLNS